MTLKQEPTQLVEYVSFSGVKDWNFCPQYYKITRIDKSYKFEGNVHTAFGTAMHSVMEHMILDRKKKAKQFLINESKRIFTRAFRKELNMLPVYPDSKIVLEMHSQAPPIIEQVLDILEEHFGADYEYISTEEQIDILIDEYKMADYDFRGIVDLTIKTSDGKYHVIDWKTCSWGWDLKRRSDPMTTYQLTYYKHFLAKKHKIDLKNIETYFILLKRTAKKDNVEVMRVSSGPRKTTNALRLLENAVHNIDHGNFIKKKTSCRKCAVWRTLCEG